MASQEYFWSEDELRIIREHPLTSVKELTHLLPNRNYWGIRTKKSRLGLARKAKVGTIRNSLELLTDFDKGFLVGLLEGEGFFSISIQAGKRDGDSIMFKPLIGVEMTDGEVVKRMHKLLDVGGVVTKHPTPNRKLQIYRYSTSDRECIRLILEVLSPRLISDRKRQAAKLMMEFCTLRPRTAHNLPRPITRREMEIFQEMKQYTLKGTPIKSKLYPELVNHFLSVEATKA